MDILEKAGNYFLDVYNWFPLDVEKGRGVYLYDKNGSCYLDFLAGIAVNALGYQHPAINEAVEKQLHRNLHLSNFLLQDVQVELAERLINISKFSKLFFSNSGTEAIEGLLKLVKKWGNSHNKHEIIAFEGSFHGRTLGALSLTMQEKYQKNFHPLLPKIIKIPFDDVDAFNDAVNNETLAIFYEGITGEGGIRSLSDEMFRAMEEARDTYNFLIIADEIQTGAGRTGKFYYYEHTKFKPDAIASAKGLGGGLPLGAFLVSEKLVSVFDRGEHGTTYGGNPLACASGLAAVNIISDEHFLHKVEIRGNYLKSKLAEIVADFGDIATEVRGMGLMVGLEVKKDAQKIMQEAFRQGLIFNIAGGNTLRFVPPLIVDESEIDEAYEKLRLTFKRLFG